MTHSIHGETLRNTLKSCLAETLKGAWRGWDPILVLPSPTFSLGSAAKSQGHGIPSSRTLWKRCLRNSPNRCTVDEAGRFLVPPASGRLRTSRIRLDYVFFCAAVDDKQEKILKATKEIIRGPAGFEKVQFVAAQSRESSCPKEVAGR